MIAIHEFRRHDHRNDVLREIIKCRGMKCEDSQRDSAVRAYFVYSPASRFFIISFPTALTPNNGDDDGWRI